MSPRQALSGTFHKASQSRKSSDSSDLSPQDIRGQSLKSGIQLWGVFPTPASPGPSFLSLMEVKWKRHSC